jgi:chromosome segregation ATPase
VPLPTKDLCMENRTNASLLIGFILMTLVAAVFGYLYYHERAITSQQDKDLEVRVTDLALSEMKLDSIAKQLDLRIAQVRKLGGNLTELKRIKAQLEADRSALRKGNNFLTARINEYETFLTKKDSEIARLSGENKTLSSRNETLTVVNTSLLEEKELLTDSLTEVLTKATDLAAKVNIASALRARAVKVYAISSNGREREGDGIKAKRVDNIRVEFSLEKNPLSRQEIKRIYMKILDPQGATLADASLGSGVFQYAGSEQTYTLSKDVPYTNSDQAVTILYNRTREFQKGTYMVELYAEGQKIGAGTFSVK